MRCKSNPVTRALHKILIKAQGGNGAAAGEPEPSAPIGGLPRHAVRPDFTQRSSGIGSQQASFGVRQ